MKQFHEDDKYNVVTDNCTSNIFDALKLKKPKGSLLSAFIVLPDDLERQLKSMQQEGKVSMVSKEFAKNYIDSQIEKETELAQIDKTDLKQLFQNVSHTLTEQQKDKIDYTILDKQIEK